MLCALCGGKRKQAVQDQLAGLGLVRTLADMFARLNWDAPPPPAPEPHGIHGPGCACNPQSVSASLSRESLLILRDSSVETLQPPLAEITTGLSSEPHGIHGPGCACNPLSVSAVKVECAFQRRDTGGRLLASLDRCGSTLPLVPSHSLAEAADSLCCWCWGWRGGECSCAECKFFLSF